MKGLRSAIFVIIFFILAALIGFGLERLTVSVLPSDAAGFLVREFSLGAHALSFNVNVCGIIGLILSYLIVSYLMKK
ncbi:MAG: hypothetical protein LBR90_04015 [Elusimicrobiota bacterium]|jgi:hypothetical protein|nr:hypothetical protein [Elusimicrobiota bacterium]